MSLRSPLRAPLRRAVYRTPDGPYGWVPEHLGAALLARWSASDTDRITLSSAKVTSWRDSVANYDMVQGTDAARPTWSSSSFNGYPGITFDGTDDELTLASMPFPSGASASEVWAVASQDGLAADTTTRHLFGYGGTANATRRALVRRVATGVNRYGADTGDNSSAIATNDAAVDFSGRHLVRAVFGATSTSVSINGGSLTTVSVVPVTGTTRVRIGASTANTAANFWNGKISEVMVTSALSTADAALLSTYLLARRAL